MTGLILAIASLAIKEKGSVTLENTSQMSPTPFSFF